MCSRSATASWSTSPRTPDYRGHLVGVNDFYGAKLAIMNVGDIFSLGPEEGAFAVEGLVKPAAVIPSHVNEAATQGGVVQPGTRMERFLQLADSAKTHVPRSGSVMTFDQAARCVAGGG